MTARPSVFARVFCRTSRPLASAASRVIPKSILRGALSSTYRASRWLAEPRPVINAAGVEYLHHWRTRSLKLSDDLSRQISRTIHVIAVLDGVVTGTGGFLLAPVEVAALLFVALHGIYRTGQCYGYALNEPQDRAYVLAILTLAGTQSLCARRELNGSLGDLRNCVLVRSIETVAMETLAQQVLRILCVESIPGFGAVVGSLANLALIRQVLVDSRKILQQRWLRDNRFLL
jgi:hypothetical protein